MASPEYQGSGIDPDEVRRQLDAQREDFQQRERGLQDRLERVEHVASAILQGASQDAAETPSAQDDPCPDPVEDRDGFIKWQARQAERNEQVAKTAAQQAADDARVNDMWSRFQEEFPHYAESPALVQQGFLKVRNAGNAPSDPKALRGRVAQEVDSMIEAAGSRKSEARPDTSRTEGLGGGSQDAPTRSTKRGEAEDTRTFAQQIRDRQSKSEFFGGGGDARE